MLPQMPVLGSPIPHDIILPGLDVSVKKRLADVALNTARSAGATYADVRIQRTLNQNVATREDKVQNVSNTEVFGVGVRVIANGSWGFAASSDVTTESVAAAAKLAVQIAKINSKILKEPVQLAPQKGYGDVSWKTPIEINGFDVPIKDKIDLLLSVNDAALKNGASFANSAMFVINEQKYFASTDGSYIDQDIHRLWPIFQVTRIDKTTGKFQTRNSLGAPVGMVTNI